MLLVDGCNGSSGKQTVTGKMLKKMAAENVSSAPCHQCRQGADGFEVIPV